MPLETGTYLPDLVVANPAHADGVTQGDAHIRLIKTVLKNTFPNFTDVAMASTQAQIDAVVALTSQINTNTSNVATLTSEVNTLNADLLASVGANLFYAAPNGSAGTPSWRNLVSADLHGTTTNDNAASGIVGEYAEADFGSPGSGMTMGNGTPQNITSITLGAGDWDVWGSACYYGVGTVSSLAVNSMFASLSTSSGALDYTQGKCASMSLSGISNSLIYVGLGTAPMAFNIGPVRYSLAGNTTIYLVGECIMSTGGVSAIGGYGCIKARRVR